MSDKLIILIIFITMFVGFLGIVYATIQQTEINKQKEQYALVKYTAKQYDTFWHIYQNMYPEWISYDEALNNFKKDNDLYQYELYENHVYWLRRYE